MKEGLLLIFVLPVSVVVYAQRISGEVTNENAQPLSYVSIGIRELNKGTLSTEEGTYQIDLSGVDNDKIISFSAVGYESFECKISALRSKQTESLNVTLKRRIVQMPEVVVLPDKAKSSYLGADKAGRMAWIWSEAIKGAEIGTLFRNHKSVVLGKFYFHVRKNYCDSILYRVRIYKGAGESPKMLLNTRDIRFVSKIKRGWDSIDLADYKIVTDQDFIITLETLQSWHSGKRQTTHLSLANTKGALSYSRASSMSRWLEFSGQMSFKIGITEQAANENMLLR